MSEVSNAAVEEMAYQWTGVPVPYAKLDPRFVTRIRGIVEPAIHHLRRSPNAEADRAQPARLGEGAP